MKKFMGDLNVTLNFTIETEILFNVTKSNNQRKFEFDFYVNVESEAKLYFVDEFLYV